MFTGKNYKSGVLICNSNRKLPFGMGSKKSRQFLNFFMSSAASRGPKILKICIFHENGLFHLYFSCVLEIRMSCHIFLERTAETENNDI